MDFVHIGYHNQVLWAADSRKAEFGSVQNFSNYCNCFNKVRVFVVISQSGMIFFIFGTVIGYDAVLMLVK